MVRDSSERGAKASADSEDPLILVPDAATHLTISKRYGRTKYSHRRSIEPVFEVIDINTDVAASSIYRIECVPARNDISSALSAGTRCSASCT
jgi:hypothetical protein